MASLTGPLRKIDLCLAEAQQCQVLGRDKDLAKRIEEFRSKVSKLLVDTDKMISVMKQNVEERNAKKQKMDFQFQLRKESTEAPWGEWGFQKEGNNMIEQLDKLAYCEFNQELLEITLSYYITAGEIHIDNKYLEQGHVKIEILVAALIRLSTNGKGNPGEDGHGSLAFPWKRYYLEEHVDYLFNNLKSYRWEADETRQRFSIQHWKPQFRMLQEVNFRTPAEIARNEDRDKKFICFKAKEDAYIKMDILADYFTEPARMRACRKDQRASPFDQWGDKDRLKELFFPAIEAARKRTKKCELDNKLGQNGLDSYILRESIFGNRKIKECTQFKPTLARSVIEKLRASRVVDFSAGWGDRLLGAAASSKVHSYLAFDPNIDLRPGHTAMLDRFVHGSRRKNFQVIYEPAQSAKIPYGRTFDLIFTSPPFFDLEIYTDKKGQSVQDFSSRDAWLVGFLFVCLKKFWDKLECGGHMAIHMSDDWNNKICEPMCLFALARLPNCIYNGVIASVGARGTPRPIWVFQKLVRSSNWREEIRSRAEECLYNCYRSIHQEINARMPLDVGLRSPVLTNNGHEVTFNDLLNPKIVTSVHNVAKRHIDVNVIRDDMLIGGTKQRALSVFFSEEAEEYVYAGPVEGYAQIALAHVCSVYKKKATVFLAKQRNGKRHKFTKKAEELGGNVIEIGDQDKVAPLKAVQAAAEFYVSAKGPKTVLLPFGLHSEKFTKFLARQIASVLPDDLEKGPKRLWLVAGSATLLASFHILWPNTEFLVVQVGKKIYFDQLDGIKHKLYVSKEKFIHDAKSLPPYNAVKNYDAKLWQFVEEHGQSCDWIWNVGSDD